MLFAIHQNIDEAVTNFSRGSKCACVKSFAPNGAMPRERAVTSACEANGQTNHPARKGRVVLGFYEEMKMIVLHAEVHDAKPAPRSGGEPAPQGRKHDGRAQTGQTPRPPQCDVHGVSVAMLWAGAMVLAIMGNPGPTLGGRAKWQCELSCCLHWRLVFVTYCFANCNRKRANTKHLLALGAFAHPCACVKSVGPRSRGSRQDCRTRARPFDRAAPPAAPAPAVRRSHPVWVSKGHALQRFRRPERRRRGSPKKIDPATRLSSSTDPPSVVPRDFCDRFGWLTAST